MEWAVVHRTGYKTTGIRLIIGVLLYYGTGYKEFDNLLIGDLP